MGFKIFDKLNKGKSFFPKFDMTINTKSDNVLSFVGCNYIVDNISMHIADFIILGPR